MIRYDTNLKWNRFSEFFVAENWHFFDTLKCKRYVIIKIKYEQGGDEYDNNSNV